MATLLPLYLRFLIFLAETQKMRIYREKKQEKPVVVQEEQNDSTTPF